jgi:hypothetical protein
MHIICITGIFVNFVMVTIFLDFFTPSGFYGVNFGTILNITGVFVYVA